MSKVVANSTLVIALILALITLGQAFGLNITQNQQDAITGLAAAVLAFLGVWFHPSIPVGNTGGN